MKIFTNMSIILENRHLIQYKNGIYDIKTDKFYTNEDLDQTKEKPNGVPIRKFLDQDFNTNFENQSWSEIPTPYFDDVFKSNVAIDNQAPLIEFGKEMYKIQKDEPWKIIIPGTNFYYGKN